MSQLPPAKRAAASDAFQQLANQELLPVCQLHADPVRCKIDQAVMAMLDLPHDADALASLRRLWCAEPSVHGDNAQARAMLESPKPSP